MTTTEQEKEKKEKGLEELSKDMDATIYRFNLLCNRFEKDKDGILLDGKEIKEVVKKLQEELKVFTKMREELSNQLTTKLESMADDVLNKADTSLQQISVENADILSEAVKKLNGVLKRTEYRLKYLRRLGKKRLVLMVIGFFVLPVMTGVIASKRYMSDPIMKFNKETCEVYKQRCLFVK